MRVLIWLSLCLGSLLSACGGSDPVPDPEAVGFDQFRRAAAGHRVVESKVEGADGVALATYVYLPAQGNGPFPVLVAAADPQDRLGDGPDAQARGREASVRPRVDVQLLGEPAVLRGGRPRDAGAWRARLLAAHAVRAHIYRHHRRYRITEGSEEIQMRKVAGHLFGSLGARRDA
jgi:hypothetical protein